MCTSPDYGPLEALAIVYKCYYTHPDAVVEVWEPPKRFERGDPPNRIGCHRCNRMVRIAWD